MQMGLGIAYYGAAQYDHAIETFARLLAQEPDNEMSGEIFGRSCTVLTDHQNALCRGLLTMAQQHPENANLDLYAAVDILHQPATPDKLEQARKLLEQALARDPKLAEAHYQLGMILQTGNQWQASIGEMHVAVATP